MLAFAVVVVGGVMIAEPLRAVAHFSHCPHGGGQKAVWSRDNAKSVESAPAALSSVGRIASLLIFTFQGDFSPFYGFWGREGI